MATTEIRYKELTEKASNMRAYLQAQRDSLAQMDDCVNFMTDVWESEAQNATVQQYRATRKDVDAFLQKLEEYIALLDRLSQRFQQADAQARQRFLQVQ